MITQSKLLIEKQQNDSFSLMKMGQLYGSSKNLALAEMQIKIYFSYCLSQLRLSTLGI